MPHMGGRQFRVRQSREPRWASIPVLLLSAEPDLAHEAADLGVATFLQKPVEPQALLGAIRRHC